MKRGFILSLLFLLLGCKFGAYAQLTEREDNPSLIATGTRPVSGNFGLVIGPSFVELEDFFDKNINARGLPLMKLKYYITDEIEVRLGFQHYKKRQDFEGDLVVDRDVWGVTIDNDFKSFNRISPGIAYHFSPKNLLDIYVGLEIPFGSDKYEVTRRFEESSNFAFADFIETSVAKTTRVAGYSFFVGVQAFVADLPFAVGMEYGIAGWRNSGLEYDVEHIERIDGVTTSMNYFAGRNPLNYSGLMRYDNLSYEKFESGSSVRITFTYYFMR